MFMYSLESRPKEEDRLYATNDSLRYPGRAYIVCSDEPSPLYRRAWGRGSPHPYWQIVPLLLSVGHMASPVAGECVSIN